MKRVLGIGGIFFKGKDPEALRAWYANHLGIETSNEGGTVFPWHDPDHPDPDGMTVWSIFDASTKYLGSGGSPFMINYRVADLDALIATLRAEGCDVDEKVDDSEYGKFGWVTDPEGHRIELWQPPASQ